MEIGHVSPSKMQFTIFFVHVQVFKTNTAVSDIHAYYDVVSEARNAIAQTEHFTIEEKALISTVGFGHMADGDIHINIGVEGRENEALADKLCDFVDPLVMDYIKKHGGSVSGEHGVGQQKAQYLGFSKSPEMINAMRLIKSSFDPNGILNPYKVLP